MDDMNARLTRWTLSGETGASSKCMASVLSGGKPKGFGSYPHDGGDFGRCMGLLDAVPEFRDRLGEMRAVNQYWAAIIDAWDEIEAAWRKGDCYDVIRRVVEPIEAKDASIVRIGKGVSIRFGA